MAENNLRIYICGGHSTGKTTILKDLLDHVRVKPELDVARGVMQQLGKFKSGTVVLQRVLKSTQVLRHCVCCCEIVVRFSLTTQSHPAFLAVGLRDGSKKKAVYSGGYFSKVGPFFKKILSLLHSAGNLQ